MRKVKVLSLPETIQEKIDVLIWTGFQKFSRGGGGGVRRSQPRSDFFLDPRLQVISCQGLFCFDTNTIVIITVDFTKLLPKYCKFRSKVRKFVAKFKVHIENHKPVF